MPADIAVVCWNDLLLLVRKRSILEGLFIDLKHVFFFNYIFYIRFRNTSITGSFSGALKSPPRRSLSRDLPSHSK